MTESERVYSTADGDLRSRGDVGRPAEPVTPNDGIVRVSRETSGRRGKTVTVVRGVPARDLDAVASDLKRLCGTGGSARTASSRSRATTARRSSPASRPRATG